MEKDNKRGSAKLWEKAFEKNAPSPKELNKALAEARQSYKVLRWWKYGQPAIDLIKATIQVKTEDVGSTVQDIMSINGGAIQATAECFPFGIPFPEGIFINVALERQVK